MSTVIDLDSSGEDDDRRVTEYQPIQPSQRLQQRHRVPRRAISQASSQPAKMCSIASLRPSISVSEGFERPTQAVWLKILVGLVELILENGSEYQHNNEALAIEMSAVLDSLQRLVGRNYPEVQAVLGERQTGPREKIQRVHSILVLEQKAAAATITQKKKGSSVQRPYDLKALSIMIDLISKLFLAKDKAIYTAFQASSFDLSLLTAPPSVDSFSTESSSYNLPVISPYVSSFNILQSSFVHPPPQEPPSPRPNPDPSSNRSFSLSTTSTQLDSPFSPDFTTTTTSTRSPPPLPRDPVPVTRIFRGSSPGGNVQWTDEHQRKNQRHGAEKGFVLGNKTGLVVRSVVDGVKVLVGRVRRKGKGYRIVVT